MIILIADSGSTTTDWAVIHNGEATRLHTAGINPIHQDNDTISSTLTHLQQQLAGVQPTHTHFYGAGCVGGEVNSRMASLLATHFHKAHIEVESDLLGAARSLCGGERGIAGILGTGANSCYYDGKAIVENIKPLGYILGDEGSGASLGKAFLRALLRNELGKALQEEFFSHYNTDYPTIIHRIYREPAANRYLASLSPFIAAHIDNEAVRRIVSNTMAAYIDNHIMRYDYRNTPMHLTGSVAYHYRDIIEAVAHSRGIVIGGITCTPINGLITYHSTQQ